MLCPGARIILEHQPMVTRLTLGTILTKLHLSGYSILLAIVVAAVGRDLDNFTSTRAPSSAKSKRFPM